MQLFIGVCSRATTSNQEAGKVVQVCVWGEECQDRGEENDRFQLKDCSFKIKHK